MCNIFTIYMHHIVLANRQLSWTNDNAVIQIQFKALGHCSNEGKFEGSGFNPHGTGGLIDFTCWWGPFEAQEMVGGFIYMSEERFIQ